VFPSPASLTGMLQTSSMAMPPLWTKYPSSTGTRCVCVCVCVCVCMCVHACLCVCMYIYICVCGLCSMYVCMLVCMYVYAFTHACICVSYLIYVCLLPSVYEQRRWEVSARELPVHRTCPVFCLSLVSWRPRSTCHVLTPSHSHNPFGGMNYCYYCSHCCCCVDRRRW